ncbi:UvrD-helicase domain-containing protein [Pusillimonas sp. MFBS29]|uniref:UvrD-helicase domain-containing protein n=1 Tax=Pusillimonas sp. MFBS29 TaxID=2886690 RepID=UPI001D0FB5AB|nr:UvrD-helicase domain-containing protein [Pusillimonas sp. MFBS29]MCC2597790.1 UvrD-helicase domain-containing protein [Pusillimonas sp. MFBS29]
MPAVFHPSLDDIAYAERILLPAGESFDKERLRFICDMGTLDLLAVPGSGKTTALLAKLLILDRYLPRMDGSGILVISHTNAAVDEIRDRIGTHCTQLFRYPNFIGTIQRFVDEFLAVPYYVNWYKKAPLHIDDAAYEALFSNPPFSIKGFTKQESKNARYFLMLNVKRIRWSWVDGKATLTEGYAGKAIDFKKPLGRTKPSNYSDWSASEKGRIREWVHAFKLMILKLGYLCYDDAYFLASVALNRNPQIKSMLQQRFAHVFVDEMQDMERHQYELLEDLFFDVGAYRGGYQRIGDRNQSIFDGRSSVAEEFWESREKVLELNGSYRLGPILADVVSVFGVSPIRIEGRQKNPDGSAVMIKPRFIVYSDTTRLGVIQRFASIVRELANAQLLPLHDKSRCKAVCWTIKGESKKTRLTDYHPPYARIAPTGRVHHEVLESHLALAQHDVTSFSPIEQTIVDALLRVLRLESATDAEDSHFVKNSMKGFLQTNSPDVWENYQSNMYRWCLAIAGGDRDSALQEIRQWMPEFCAAFDRQFAASKDFVFGELENLSTPDTTPPQEECNVVIYDGIRVDVSTVHRVKGETHTATLYMESFYEKGGGGNYESERLMSQFHAKPLSDKLHNRVRQSAKMVYVGFSRPTHLLCFAVHESRFQKMEAEICTNTWEIVRL